MQRTAGLMMGRAVPVLDSTIPNLGEFVHDIRTPRQTLAWRLEDHQPLPPDLLASAYPWCNLSAAAQLVRLWAQNSVGPFMPPGNADVVAEEVRLSYWHKQHGSLYTPGTLAALLKFWQFHGLYGTRLIAFARVELRDVRMLRLATQFFGGLLAGVAFPLTALNQFQHTATFTLDALPLGVAAPASWGRGALAVTGFDQRFFTGPLWGRYCKMSPQWAETYWEEVYGVLTSQTRIDWDGTGGIIDVAGLMDASKAQ